MIQIPLSVSGPADAFAQAVKAHRDALEAHLMGKPGRPAPATSALTESVIERQPQQGDVAMRGPDRFVVLPYEIVDDTPRPADHQQAIEVLRETLK